MGLGLYGLVPTSEVSASMTPHNAGYHLMKITNVSMEDARKMADLLALVTNSNKLIDAMKVAGIHMTGRAVEKKEETYAWLKEIATGMAQELAATAKSPAPAASAAAPKVVKTIQKPKSKGK